MYLCGMRSIVIVVAVIMATDTAVHFSFKDLEQHEDDPSESREPSVVS